MKLGRAPTMCRMCILEDEHSVSSGIRNGIGQGESQNVSGYCVRGVASSSARSFAGFAMRRKSNPHALRRRQQSS